MASPGSIDQAVIRTRDNPGPSAYTLPEMADGSGNGVKFSDAVTKTCIEQVIYEKKDVPGPDMYVVHDANEIYFEFYFHVTIIYYVFFSMCRSILTLLRIFLFLIFSKHFFNLFFLYEHVGIKIKKVH